LTSKPERIGIFGGSFNPLHHGHLIVAEFASETLKMDKVFFAPVVHPPHKDGRALLPIEHRLAMIETAIADNDRFELTLVDVERPGPHYSVDTVKIIQELHPGSQLYFVMGGDSFRDFSRWHAPDEIIKHCRLAVMRRPSTRPMQPTMHDEQIPNLSDYVDIIEAPPIGISATRVREQIRGGKSVRYLVPNPVLAYIHEKQLYQD